MELLSYILAGLHMAAVLVFGILFIVIQAESIDMD